MKTALPLLALLLATATSVASPWPANVPPGWTEDRSLATAELAQLRGLPQTKAVEVTIFVSPERDAQLTLMKWNVELSPVSRDTIKEFDQGMAEGAAEKATRHLTDARSFANNQMIGTSTDELNNLRITYKRIYGLDKDGIVHMVSAICTTSGAPNPCDATQASLHLDLPDAADLDAAEARDNIKQIGFVVGLVLAVILVIWTTRRRRN